MPPTYCITAWSHPPSSPDCWGKAVLVGGTYTYRSARTPHLVYPGVPGMIHRAEISGTYHSNDMYAALFSCVFFRHIPFTRYISFAPPFCLFSLPPSKSLSESFFPNFRHLFSRKFSILPYFPILFPKWVKIDELDFFASGEFHE